MVPLYRRTQPGTLVVTLLLGSIVFIGVIWYSAGWHPVIAIVEAVLLVALLLFRSLTIEIDRVELRCFFGDGLIKRRFPLAKIVSAKPVRNRWYYGWGVRLIPSGWMFNVSGLDAVELLLSTGKRFRIGTDNPQDVIEAINHLKTVGA
jgi:hypothetical protein